MPADATDSVKREREREREKENLSFLALIRVKCTPCKTPSSKGSH